MARSPPTIKLPEIANSATTSRRQRSASIVKVEQVGDRTTEEVLDQSAYVNINANWVNAKGTVPEWSSKKMLELFAGAWLIHVVLICIGKIILDAIPGMSQQVSWTLVNLLYLAVSHTDNLSIEN